MTGSHRFYPLIAIILFGALFYACGSSSQEQIELEWQEGTGYRYAELPVDRSGEFGFEQIPISASKDGVINSVPEELMNENRVLMNGSRGAAGDIDGDDLPDLCYASIDEPNTLYIDLCTFQVDEIPIVELEV